MREVFAAIIILFFMFASFCGGGLYVRSQDAAVILVAMCKVHPTAVFVTAGGKIDSHPLPEKGSAAWDADMKRLTKIKDGSTLALIGECPKQPALKVY